MERRIVDNMLDAAIKDHRHAVAMGICMVTPCMLLIGAVMLGLGETGRANVIMGIAGTALTLHAIGWTIFTLRKSTGNIKTIRFRLDNPGRAIR